MPIEKTLTSTILIALDTQRLADLLLEFTAGNAIAKRRSPLELASRSGGDVMSDIRKQLIALGRSSAFVNWR